MNQKGPRLGEPASLWRMRAVPVATVMIASALPLMLPLVASSPVLPPLGVLFFLSWQLLRTEMWPVWIGLPLGLWDDLFSGQPFGSAILLWSLMLIALDFIETRFPWHGFAQDWLVASVVTAIYILISALFAGSHVAEWLTILAPQLLLSILLYPMFGRMVAFLDRFRLRRFRTLG